MAPRSSHHAHPKSSTTQEKAIHYYLAAYNVFSALGWSAILLITTLHLFGLLPASVATGASHKSGSIFSWLFPFNSPVSTRTSSKLPTWARHFFQRAETTHAAVGLLTKYVQSAAILEIAHVLLGWIKSPLKTTAAQVASRLAIVWVVVDRYPAAQKNPLYASLVLSWSVTEAIRYAFYACTLLAPSVPRPLILARYSTFYVLYLTGASSEAFLLLSTLPGPLAGAFFGGGVPNVRHVFKGWGLFDAIRASLFLVWWPGLYVLYTYMIEQRKKVLLEGAPSANNSSASSKKKTK